MSTTAEPVKKHKPQMAWTPERTQRLRDLYLHHTHGEIAAILSRETGRTITQSTISNKCHVLGLRKRDAQNAAAT